MSDDAPFCGFRWPLLDPSPADRESGAHHICGLPQGHDGEHVCPHDGVEHINGVEL